MSLNPAKEQNAAPSARPIDPNVLQRQAANPDTHIWVNASAGSGKTKVLTDRILRLLLPRSDGRPGTAIHKILGLTFTKAAANEMLLRLHKVLRGWSILPDGDLQQNLCALLGQKPTQDQTHAAQNLFTRVIDAPGGLKIMTIHAFCQSVLARFPLEAGLAPVMSTLDDSNACALITRALTQTIAKTDHAEHAATLGSALPRSQCEEVIRAIIQERHQYSAILKTQFGVEGIYSQFCALNDIQAHMHPDAMLRQECENLPPQAQRLKKIAQHMLDSKGKTDQARGQAMAHYLATNTPEDRLTLYTDYYGAFIAASTSPNRLRATMATKPILKADPDADAILTQEGERLLKINAQMQAANAGFLLRSILTIATDTLAMYDTLKTQHNALDYNDMILRTLALIQKSPSWVMYKLDEGIDHILVDEAQDTNPEQWQIIETLCADMFAHSPDSAAGIAQDRSLFVVGDEKQSIYSFQRAAPAEFHRMRGDLQGKANAAGQSWSNVAMQTSFRSAPAILQAIDIVFASDSMRKGVSESPVQHHPYRRGQGGLARLWPVFEDDEKADINPWDPPIKISHHESGAVKFARFIAQEISTWLSTQRRIEGRNAPIQAGDILIIMKSRSGFVPALMRALKDQNIPVSGADRLVLTRDIAVQDLLAIADMILFPEDNLALASALKSPLIGLNEDQLFTLAQPREHTLWGALQRSKDPALQAIKAYLTNVLEHAANNRPYELFNHILTYPCPANAQSGLSAIKARLGQDTQDILDQLLNAALQYEQTETPSLQGFCRWLRSDDKDIKREHSASSNAVRIMTIHGAKGLEAPIVIMPDTMLTPGGGAHSAGNRLLWPDKTGMPIPLWSPRSNDDFPLYHEAKNQIKTLEDQEYRRLLYVAMTRAEDELYIGGYRGIKTPQDKSWYYAIERAFKEHAEAKQLPCSSWQIDSPFIAEAPEAQNSTKHEAHNKASAPNWLHSPAPTEPKAAFIPVTPSRENAPWQDQASPQQEPLDYDPLLRGHVTHRLLELIPRLPPGQREEAITAIIEAESTDLPFHVQNDIQAEIAALLDSQDLAFIFDPQHSIYTEHAFIAKTDTQLIRGIIDRLVITPDTVWIIDYKTGLAGSKDYSAQLKLYAQGFAILYPNHSINTAILWTQTAKLEIYD